jgi:hypothetical protein
MVDTSLVPRPRRRRNLYLFLVGLILVTMPLYCAGIIAIRQAHGESTASPSVTAIDEDQAGHKSSHIG